MLTRKFTWTIDVAFHVNMTSPMKSPMKILFEGILKFMPKGKERVDKGERGECILLFYL